MTDKKDENDRAREGTLPLDPGVGTEKVGSPLRVVDPNELRETPEPSAVPQERALLGALLWAAQNHPETLRVRAVVDLLDSGEPFYVRAHGDIYNAFLACEEAKSEHDPVAVNAQLARSGRQCGGLDALRALVGGASTVSERQARVYAEAIRNAWARREIIAASKRTAIEAKDPRTDIMSLVDRMSETRTELANRVTSTSSVVSISDSAAGFIKRMVGAKNTAVSTGLRDLDMPLNGGLRPGEVSVIAARLNVGKSNLATQIAEHMVEHNETVGALYVSLEMGHEMFTARILSARSGVPLNNLRRASINPTQWQQLSAAAGRIAGRPLFFADSQNQTLSSIYATASDASRRLAKDGKKLGLVVIDHLGLVKPSAEALKKANREQQVAETSRGQRFIATEFGCHVLGIAQIGRESEKQTGGTMPKLHHLRETDSIGQDADLVLILHRPRDPGSGMFDNTKPPALAIAKGRMDETAVMLLDYDPTHARFSDWNGQETYADIYEPKARGGRP